VSLPSSSSTKITTPPSLARRGDLYSERMTRRTAKIILGVVIGGVVIAAWLGRGRPGPVDRMYNEIITVFLAMFTVLIAALPVAFYFGGAMRVRRRAVKLAAGCVPVAAALGWLTLYWFRTSTARLETTLIFGAVMTALLGIMALLDWRSKRPGPPRPRRPKPDAHPYR
jgi:hypothetical protein